MELLIGNYNGVRLINATQDLIIVNDMGKDSVLPPSPELSRISKPRWGKKDGKPSLNFNDSFVGKLKAIEEAYEGDVLVVADKLAVLHIGGILCSLRESRRGSNTGKPLFSVRNLLMQKDLRKE